jgi:hypothetical protein
LFFTFESKSDYKFYNQPVINIITEIIYYNYGKDEIFDGHCNHLFICGSYRLCPKPGSVIIGELIEERPEITIDFDRLTASWEKVLSEGGVRMNFTDVGIVLDRSGNYLLMEINYNRTIEAYIPLVLVDGFFYEQLTGQGAGLTVSCSGCATGCHPEIVNGKGYCWPFCTVCSKTETLTSGGVVDLNPE